MIELINVKKTYCSQKDIKTQALQGLNLKIQSGMTFIVGQTGCGKSTLLNIVGKLDDADEGKIFVDGVDLNALNAKESEEYRNRYVGVVFQEYNLLDELTVGENIRLAKRLQGEESCKEEEVLLLERLGLSGMENKYPDELSGGQRQRVAIARALIKNPKLLLADEPTGALDVKTAEEILHILKEISLDIPVVVVSHDIEFTKKYSDRIIEFSKGVVISDQIRCEERNERNAKFVLQKEELSKKKKSLSIKECFRFVKINFCLRIKRLISMFLISAILFSVSGLIFVSFSFNEKTILADTIKDNDIRYLSVVNENIYNSIDRRDSAYTMNLSSADIKQIKDATGKQAYPLFHSFGDIYSGYFEDPTGLNDFEKNFGNEGRGGGNWSSHSLYYQTELLGGIEIDERIAEDLSCSLMEGGKFPETENEILISEYIYELFWYYGYKDRTTDSEVLDIKEPSDIVGKKILLANKEFVITGVLNVGDNSRFAPLKEMTNTDNEAYSEQEGLIVAWEAELLSSLNAVVFVCPGYYDSVLLPAYESRKAAQGCSISIYEKKDPDKNHVYGSIESFSSIAYLSEEIKSEIIWKGEEKNTLQKNEMILQIVPEDMEYYRIKGRGFADIFAEKPLTKETLSDYAQYIFDDFSSVWLRDYGMDFYSEEFEVVGIYCNSNKKSVRAYFSADAYDKLIDFYGLYPFKTAFVSVLGNIFDRKTIAEIDDSSRFAFGDKYSWEIFRMSVLMKDVRRFGSGIALACMLLSGLLLGNYISIVIDDKRRQIGVLRTLGADKKALLGIFGTEGLIISSFIAVFGSLGAATLGYFVDKLIKRYYAYTVSFISVGFLEIVLIFILALVVGSIASYLPVSKSLKKTPIECMKIK